MKNKIITLLFSFITMLPNINAQYDDILCNPCIQQLIDQENIVDIQLSNECSFKVIFIKSNGGGFVRYRNDICTTPPFIDLQYCEDWFSIGIGCSSSSNCDIEIEMFQAVECILPRIVATGEVLLVREYANGIQNLPDQIGAKFMIGYTQISGGISFCQQGTPVRINCVSEVSAPSDYNNCTSFDDYNSGNLIPQAYPKFSLKSGNINNAKVISTAGMLTWIQNALEISNNVSVDFNVERVLTEDKVSRLAFDLNVPVGKSGIISLETNNPNVYSLQLKFENNTIRIFSKQIVNNTSQLVEIKDEYFLQGESTPISMIFQPFQDRFELWVNRVMVYSGIYTSNMVTKLNFASNNTMNNSQLIIDNLCYTEWTQSIITNQYDPVCVNGKEYPNQSAALRDGYVDEYSYGVCDFPLCPNFISPANNTTNIDVNTQLEWELVPSCTHYYLEVNTVPASSYHISKLLLRGQNQFVFENMPFNTKINVILNTSNSVGSTFCKNITFTTKSNIQVPTCTSLLFPNNNAQNVSTNPIFQWNTSNNATGYKLKIGTTNGGSNLLNQNVGNVTTYQSPILPFETLIYVSIISYNSAGESINCSSTTFRTKQDIQIPSCTYLTSPVNNAQNVPTTIYLFWQISAGATGYKLKVGTTDEGEDIISLFDLGNVTSRVINGLPKDKMLYITIVPYNSAGASSNCTSTRITTEKDILLPTCTSVTSPGNNEQNVPTSINMTWMSSPGATGYRYKIGTTSGGSDIKSLTNAGNFTNTIVEGLPTNKFLCVTIIPYNASGETQNCTNTCFKTIQTSATNDNKFETINIYPNPSSGIVNINGPENDLNITDINLHDSKGLFIQSWPSETKILDLSNLNSGFYYLHMVTKNKTIVKKIILIK